MAVLPVRFWPDPILKTHCAPVDGDVSELITDLFETMYAAEGRGLAAPQAGVALRVFVMDAGWKEGDMTPVACINPEIITASTALRGGEEACLSIPGVASDVIRPSEIKLRYLDVNGDTQIRDLMGAEAKIAQHEFDHLNGKVIFDHLVGELRQQLENRYLALRPGT